jgi:hypothetical protein
VIADAEHDPVTAEHLQPAAQLLLGGAAVAPGQQAAHGRVGAELRDHPVVGGGGAQVGDIEVGVTPAVGVRRGHRAAQVRVAGLGGGQEADPGASSSSHALPRPGRRRGVGEAGQRSREVRAPRPAALPSRGPASVRRGSAPSRAGPRRGSGRDRCRTPGSHPPQPRPGRSAPPRTARRGRSVPRGSSPRPRLPPPAHGAGSPHHASSSWTGRSGARRAARPPLRAAAVRRRAPARRQRRPGARPHPGPPGCADAPGATRTGCSPRTPPLRIERVFAKVGGGCDPPPTGVRPAIPASHEGPSAGPPRGATPTPTTAPPRGANPVTDGRLTAPRRRGWPPRGGPPAADGRPATPRLRPPRGAAPPEPPGRRGVPPHHRRRRGVPTRSRMAG